MNISGIRPVDGFYDYNRISPVEVTGVEQQITQTPAAAPAETKPQITQEEIDAARAKQTFGAYDYASQYNPEATYDLKGANSDLKTLDVEKAISDMEKDQAIRQYQYFVGNKAEEDQAAVRGVENFSL